MKKGTNPFFDFQQSKVKRRVGIIINTLDYLKKNRITTKYVTDLAEVCAKAISDKEDKPCNKSTLLRNNEYKSFLLAFMAGQYTQGVKSIKGYSGDDNKIKLIISNLEASVSNLRADNNRLLNRVRVLESSAKSSNLSISSKEYHDEKSSGFDNITIDFSLTCKALLQVIKASNGLISLSHDGTEIHNFGTAKRKDRVIVNKQTAAPFIKWCGVNL